jgi:hypothetical protein
MKTIPFFFDRFFPVIVELLASEPIDYKETRRAPGNVIEDPAVTPWHDSPAEAGFSVKDRA